MVTYSIELMPYNNFMVSLFSASGIFLGCLWAYDLRLPIAERDKYYGDSPVIQEVLPVLTDELKELGLLPV